MRKRIEWDEMDFKRKITAGKVTLTDPNHISLKKIIPRFA